MDNRLFSCAVFIDLQKAFDLVNHSILIKKLDCLSVRGCINNWFESYLSGRKQTTEIDGYISHHPFLELILVWIWVRISISCISAIKTLSSS